MRKLFKMLAVLCCCCMLFAAFAACTPTNEGSGGGSSSGSESAGGESTGGESTGGDGPGGGDIDEEEAKLYGYRPQITEVMPAVRIDTADGSNDFATKPTLDDKRNDRIEYVDAEISVDNCEEAYEMTDVAAEVKARGNYTLQYPKKPLRIKFSKKQSMLGLHGGEKYKSWVLLADWKDLSATQNAMAFYFGQTILGSDGYYASDFRNVEVYLNGAYWGVYLLVEQQEVKEGRTSVPETEDDYTGTDIGYFFEYDGYYTDEQNMPNGAGDPTFTLDHGGQNGYTVKSDIYDDAQLKFLRNYANNVYKIASEAVNNHKYYKFNDSYTGIGPADYENAQQAVSAVIDVQSLVDMYILQEIACDPDIAWSSFLLSADMSENGSKKLMFEAPWDFDSAFGIKNGFVNSGTGMFASVSGNVWLTLLQRESWFQDMIREKWAKLDEYGVLKTSLELVREHKETYASYYTENLGRWSQRLNGDGELIGEINGYKTQGQAADYLYRWLHTRLNFLNKQWGDGSDVVTGEKPEDIKVDENIPAGAKPYKFEAESGSFGGGLNESAVRAGRTYASGGAYVGDLSGSHGKTLTFTVRSDGAATAYLFVSISKPRAYLLFEECFTVTVNGNKVTVPVREVTTLGAGEEEWYTFVEVKVAPVKLNAGGNTLVFSTVGQCTNFDYFTLHATTDLSAR